MPTHNFWHWLLDGIFSILSALISVLPIHAPIGFLDFVQLFMDSSVGLLVFFVGSYINLTWLGIVIGLWLALEIVRGGIAIYRMIVRFIPMP